LLVGLVAVHLLAAASLFFVQLPLWLKWLLGSLVGLSLIGNLLCQGALRTRFFIDRIRCTDEQWFVRMADGQERLARLIGFYSQPSVTILNFSFNFWHRRSVILLPDVTDPDEIRRLRVYLRIRQADEPVPF